MRKGKLLVLGGAALCAWGLLATPVRGESWIVKEGQPQAEIVISEKPPRMVKLAAEELQTYIEKISGAKLPIATAPTDTMLVKIYVGKSQYTDALKLSDEGLKDGAFKMVSGPSWLALLGHDSDFTPKKPYSSGHGDWTRMLKEWDSLTGEKWGNPYYHLFKRHDAKTGWWETDERGSLNAVHEFLRGLGVRWYMPGELGEIVPKKQTIELAPIDKTVRPDFPLRQYYLYCKEFCQASKDDILWQLRLGLNQAPDREGLSIMAHGITTVHCRDEVKKAHPEYFALLGGKRALDYGGEQGGDPCLSSEGLFQSNVKYVCAISDIYGLPISVGLNDGCGGILCQCDLCKGKGTPERGWSGITSDYVWDYMNRVAQEVYKTHPGQKVIGSAYSGYLMPPEKLKKLSPNMDVCIAQARSAFDDPKTRQQYLDIRKGYLEKLTGGDLYLWEYYLPPDNIPFIMPHLIADDLRSLKGISKGEFIEVETRTKTKLPDTLGANHLNLYVTSRLWWDANQDVDALLKEYYDSFYGPAAQEMKAFGEFAEKYGKTLNSSVANIDKVFELLAAARKAAGDTVYGKRIDLVMTYVQPLKEKRIQLVEYRKDVPLAKTVERKGTGLTADGKRDEAFWKDVPVYELKDLKTGNAPVSKTTFQVTWADNALCLSIRCEDADMKNLDVATRDNEDSNIWEGDNIDLFFETPKHAYYQITVNPAGAVYDMDWLKRESRWSSGADLAVGKGDTFWSIVMHIPTSDAVEGGVDPLKFVEGRKPTATAPWYFNVCRQRIRGADKEFSAFSPTFGGGFHTPSKFGKLIVE